MTPPIELLDVEEVKGLLYDPNAEDRSAPYRIPIIKREGEPSFFARFQHFRPSNVFEDLLINQQAKFLLANESKDKDPRGIVGVLKLTTYDYDGHTPDYWAVNYVDVRKDRRRQGICRSLFQELNRVLTPNDWLVGTFLSPDAQKAKLNKKIPRWVTVCPYFDDKDKFYEYCAQRGLLPKGKEEGK